MEKDCEEAAAITSELANVRFRIKQSGHAVEHYQSGKHVYAQNMES